MIIDTNVYSAFNRGSTEAIEILKKCQQIFLCTPVLGELRAGFMGGSRFEENERNLDKLLANANVNVLDIRLATTRVYADLTVFAKKKGRALSNNDIWIAALALENNLPLATFDKNFDVFTEKFGNNLIILKG